MKDSLDIISTAESWIEEGREFALATIIKVSGSSPRPIGSQMIIDRSARFQGSVSGGCVETTVVQEAQDVIATGIPKTVYFSADDTEQTWETGLSCGGFMDVYIVPGNPMTDLIRQINKLRIQKTPCGYITDLTSNTANILIKNDPENARQFAPEIQDQVRKYWNSDNSMRITTENAEFFWSQYCPTPELIIIGAAHIAQPLIKLADTVGFQTIIIDPRSAFATPERFPGTRLITEYPDDVLNDYPIHTSTAIVTLSHDPKIDDPALEVALRSKAFYVGSLGSRKTHASRLERLLANGFTEEELNRIHAPIGLNIGGRGVQDIALSIMAQIVQQKNIPV